MSLIEKNKFQILRGGVPGNYQGCVDCTFTSTSSGLLPGMFVEYQASSDNYVVVPSLEDLGTQPRGKIMWMCISDPADPDVKFTGVYVGLRGSFRAKIPTTGLTGTGFANGALLTVHEGKLKVDNNKESVGRIIEYVANDYIVADFNL